VVAPPVCTTGVPLLVRGCLSGATPRGPPWTSAVTLPHGRNGLRAWRMAVLSMFREPSLCRHVHRELLRSALLDLAPIIYATACHQRNYVERYSRSIIKAPMPRSTLSGLTARSEAHPSNGWKRPLAPMRSRPTPPISLPLCPTSTTGADPTP